MRTLFVFLLALALGACELLSASGDDVRFTTDRAAYQPGASVELRLENRSNRTVSYNLCNSRLHQLSDGGWQPAPEPDRACPAALFPLEPGQRATASLPLLDSLATGTYRFETTLYRSERNTVERAGTNTFSVRP